MAAHTIPGTRASDERIALRTSGLWRTNSAVIASRGAVVVIDPAFFPRELDAVAELARARGRVEAVVFTHGHWDHVAGWRHFPDAAVWASAALEAAIRGDTNEARKDLADLMDFDGRWYVERDAPAAWPELARVRALGDGDAVTVGDLRLEALALPGHSGDGLGLLARAIGVLVVGDYLSPCEIPFVADLDAYRATLRRLDRALDDAETVIPGHGPGRDRPLDRAAARAILSADLAYLDALAEHAAAGDESRALAVPLPRAEAVPGMRDHHRDNCAAALRAIAARP